MEKVYIYPVWVRIWHMLNAILCLVLIITGLSLQYSNPDFNLMQFNLAVSLHNICGIILTASYLWFIIANLITWNGKYYKIERKGFRKRFLIQFRFYMVGIFKGEEQPFPVSKSQKFNPMQKLSYVIVMYFIMPVLFLTGWALLFPDLIFINRIFGTSGIHFMDLVHIISGFVISIFMIIHIYLCTISVKPGQNFRSIINGWHQT